MRPHPHLYEIGVWPWLERLSVRAGRRVTLGGVPGSEWDRLRALGFDLVYLMGVWHRSAISRHIARSEPALFEGYDRAKPDWGPADIVGSPFSIREYAPDPHLGTWDDLDAVRRALNARGMGLVLDFVPNHTAFDHAWISTHPHRYVSASLEQFRAAPHAFRAVNGSTDSGPMYIAYGRDPFFPPWTDVAQLNYFEQDTRESMIRQLAAIAGHCDGVRCDMAMLVLDDAFARTWGGVVGRDDPPGEFWSEVRGELPDLLLIAEAYWDLELRLQQLGFSFTYDKGFYDKLVAADAAAVRAHFRVPVPAQSRSVRFLENHDERRSYSAFGPARIEAAAAICATAPGLRMYFDGQLEGRTRVSPVQLGRWAEESEQPELTHFYERLLRCANAAPFHEGEWTLLEVEPAGDLSHESLVSTSWRGHDGYYLLVANLGQHESRGRVRLPPNLPGTGASLLFEDQIRHGTYVRERLDLAEKGLFVHLPAGRAHLFRVG